MTDHDARLDRVRTIAVERELDAVLISHPANRFHLSGYTAEDVAPNSIAGALLIATESALLLTSPNNVEWTRSEVPEAIEVAGWQRPWPTSLAEAIRDRTWRRIGFEDEAILYSYYRGITETLDGNVELVPLGDAVDRLRRVKDAAEQELISRALRIGDDAFVAALAELQPGVTEKHLARRIEDLIREHGADGLAFPPIVAAGPHAARPHHAPSDRAIEPGEPVIIDMGARLAGYNGDLTRTVWIGEPSARLRDLYRVVAAMQDAAFARIRAGAATKEVDVAVREVARAAGFGEYLVHGVGHGIGARVHEGPSTHETSDDVYQAGEITTVEPGLYVPGWGGVRIEDVGVVEADGFRNLTTAPKRSA